MKAILEFAGYQKILELVEGKPIYVDKFVMADQKVSLPYIKIAERELGGEKVAVYRLIDAKEDLKV